MKPHATSLLIDGGVIQTLAPERPHAESMLIEAGHVTWIGSSADAPRAERVLDVQGRTVLPAFIDAHSHLYWMAEDRLQCDVGGSDIRNIPDLLERLRAQAIVKGENEWVIAVGVNEFRLREGRLPTREELDSISDGRPVAVKRTCGHAIVASSKALERIGIGADTPDPFGGIIERSQGRPNGILRERAADLLLRELPTPSASALVDSLQVIAQAYLACGVAGATEAAVGFTTTVDKEWQVWELLRGRRSFPLRMAFMLRASPAELASRGLRPSGIDLDWQIDALKFFADGTVGSRSAAVSEPYQGSPCGCGLLMQTPEQLSTDILGAARAGWHIAVHAIGDRGIDLTASIFEEVRRCCPGFPRLRVEHLAMPTPDALRRLQQAIAIVVPQHAFLSEMGDAFVSTLGLERAERLYPGRSLLDQGLIVAGSSDAPASPMSPFVGIAAAMTRSTRSGRVLNAGERLTAHEAIAMYTTGAAAAVGHTNKRGVLRPGAVADVIVLDRDPLRASAAQILGTRVEATIVGGRIAHENWGQR